MIPLQEHSLPTGPLRSLRIGEIIISSTGGDVIWTVLGSCVSVIFNVPGQLSMICHSQMPNRGQLEGKCSDGCPNPCFQDLDVSLDNRYVKCSVEYMAEVLKSRQCDVSRLNTTIIGGASVLPKLGRTTTIGEMNIQAARDTLAKCRIKINRELVGGTKGYTLWYHTLSDQLFVRIQADGEKQFELLNNR